MNGQQNVVAAGGMGLIAANFWFGGARGTVSKGIFTKGGNSSAAYSAALKKIGVELLAVAVMTLLAGLSDYWGNAMVAIIVALAILWAIAHYSGTTNAATSSTGAPQQTQVSGASNGIGARFNPRNIVNA